MRKISILAAAATMLAVACTEPSSPVVNSTSPEVRYTAGSGSSSFDYANVSVYPLNTGELQISWSQHGVGNGDINYALSGTRSITWACYNNGENHPKAQNKTTVGGNFTQAFTASADRNGKVIETETVPLPASPLTCPGTQENRLQRVVYSGLNFQETAPVVQTAALNTTSLTWP
jgi:hypothetical protein